MFSQYVGEFTLTDKQTRRETNASTAKHSLSHLTELSEMKELSFFLIIYKNLNNGIKHCSINYKSHL